LRARLNSTPLPKLTLLFFAGAPGPRVLFFLEFVDENKLHRKSAPLTLRLEDFMIDPVKEFSEVLDRFLNSDTC